MIHRVTALNGRSHREACPCQLGATQRVDWELRFANRGLAERGYLVPRDGDHRPIEWGAGDVDLHTALCPSPEL